MPIYEYQCHACGHGFEQLKKISESESADCLICETGVAKRLMSAASFQLKGTGWYVTDFKNGDQSKKQDTAGKQDISGKPSDSSEKAVSKETTTVDLKKRNKDGNKTKNSN